MIVDKSEQINYKSVFREELDRSRSFNVFVSLLWKLIAVSLCRMSGCLNAQFAQQRKQQQLETTATTTTTRIIATTLASALEGRNHGPSAICTVSKKETTRHNQTKFIARNTRACTHRMRRPVLHECSLLDSTNDQSAFPAELLWHSAQLSGAWDASFLSLALCGARFVVSPLHWQAQLIKHICSSKFWTAMQLLRRAACLSWTMQV